jgi:hyperosmotically inducible protein
MEGCNETHAHGHRGMSSMLASEQTGKCSRPMIVAHPFAENTVMRASRNLFVLSAALASAMSLLAAGCSKEPEKASAPPVTSVGTQLDDTVITSKVKSALLADPDIKSFDLKVETRKGEVQLSGYVDNQTQIDRALATTRGVEGVKNVENAITIKVGSATVGNALDDGVITTKVKSALLADPGMKSFDIAVVTRKGAVQLSGFVDSQVQIDQAVALVMKVAGVSSIDNEMSIKK